MDTLADVRVAVTVLIGRATVSIGEVLRYAPGTVVRLDTPADAPVVLFVNGIPIASGDLVAMEDGGLAVQVAEILRSGDAGAPR